MIKIFGIGLSRTGTTSLTLALSELGLHAYHFPRGREVIDSVDAATDTPVAAWYQDLDAAYPDSKFILTLRHRPEWLDSCECSGRQVRGISTSSPVVSIGGSTGAKILTVALSRRLMSATWPESSTTSWAAIRTCYSWTFVLARSGRNSARSSVCPGPRRRFRTATDAV